MLVAAFVRERLDVPIALDQLRPIQDKWAAIVHRKPLPWYAEEKLASGAFSAMLGLELRDGCCDRETKRVWRATAAGDNCIVQVRGNDITAAFPIGDSASFSNRPHLLSSLPELNEGRNELVQSSHGTWESGDTFLLMKMEWVQGESLTSFVERSLSYPATLLSCLSLAAPTFSHEYETASSMTQGHNAQFRFGTCQTFECRLS